MPCTLTRFRGNASLVTPSETTLETRNLGRDGPGAVPPFLTRLGISFNLRAISIPEAFRAALAIAPFMAGFLVTGHEIWRVAAIGAFLTCLTDSGGPVNQRVMPTLIFTTVGSILACLMPMARAVDPPVAAAAATAALAVCAFLRIYGQPMLVVGNLLMVSTVIFVDQPQASEAAAFSFAFLVGLSFLVGSLWAAALALVIWRLYPHLPARRALADAYRKLGRMSGDIYQLLQRADVTPEVWDRHARHQRHQERDAIETARAAVLGAVGWLGPNSNAAVHGIIRLEVIEQCFARLIALGEYLGHVPESPDRKAAARALRRLRPVLHILARAILSDDSTLHRHLVPSTQSMEHDLATLAANDPVRVLLTEIMERVRIAITLTVPANYVPGAGLTDPKPSWRQRWISPVQANLNWRSLALRHAVRVAALAFPVLLITLSYWRPFQAWLLIAFVVSVQPYYAMTVTRVIERVTGTMLGSFLGTLIGYFVVDRLAITIAVVVLLMAAIAIRFVSLGVFLIVLTPMVVLLTETGQYATDPWMVGVLRASYTLGGGVLALLGSFILWPSWEPNRLGSEMQRAILAHCDFADAIFNQALGGTLDITSKRRAAELAANAIEDGLQRALVEPHSTKRETLETALVVDAALRRLAGRLSVLQATKGFGGGAETVRAWRDWINRAGLALTSGGKLPPRPALDSAAPGADSLTRIARQLELIAGAL
jgi:uncharacterized membrane protein YccC